MKTSFFRPVSAPFKYGKGSYDSSPIEEDAANPILAGAFRQTSAVQIWEVGRFPSCRPFGT